MYEHHIHFKILERLRKAGLPQNNEDEQFGARLMANAYLIHELFYDLYQDDERNHQVFDQLIKVIINAYVARTDDSKERDLKKLGNGGWFLSNRLTGMSLYVDRFSGNLKNLSYKLDYFKELGINVLHLMPLFESPPGESDGGYAVSNFRKLDRRFGAMKDLRLVQKKMQERNMYLMTDMVFNHVSDQQKWALKAKAGDKAFQDYFYMYDDRRLPDEYEKTMKEIFPTAAPGNFTWVEELNKWVMTVFNHYQWDLNYRNPEVFVAMLDIVFFYANLGIDILRIDAPSFIWKELGTSCTNLPNTHKLLQLLKACTITATPGLALLGEVIQRPKQIMEYFGRGAFATKECDLLYKAPQMALQWDALATTDTRVMLAAQEVLLQKPYGTSWITYTRCHDDIGLGYDDEMIANAGFDPYSHREFIKNYYSGNTFHSPSRGALFSFNPKTGDARISGSLASLCGLEKAIEEKNDGLIKIATQKILMMQAFSFFIGGLPMLFYGDELGYMNNHEYLREPGKNYDNRWMHRPHIDWKRNELKNDKNTIEHKIFEGTRKLISLRKKLPAIADKSNLDWSLAHNIHIAAYHRYNEKQQIVCVFNFSNHTEFLTWYAFREYGFAPAKLFDHYSEKKFVPGRDEEFLLVEPYQFFIMEKTGEEREKSEK